MSHLCHILTYNLDDRQDVIRAIKDLHRKANCVLYKFTAVDPFIKSYLLKSYCLSLYGFPLWCLSSPSIKLIDIALNKLLHRVWNLPYESHSGIVHCRARISHVSNFIFDHFCVFFLVLCPHHLVLYNLSSYTLHIMHTPSLVIIFVWQQSLQVYTILSVK